MLSILLINRFVINCGLVIADPITTAWAPNWKALFTSSGSHILPSKTTGLFVAFTNSSNNLKSGLSFSNGDWVVYPDKVVDKISTLWVKEIRWKKH